MEDLFGPSVPTSADSVVAIFDFEAQQDTDLGFKKGDKIEVIKRDGDWWTGRIGSKEGTFPYNYVKKPEVMDAGDPLAQAFQSEPSLIEKVTSSEAPVDLQKMLGNNEESVLEQEVRLQNERIAGAAGLVSSQSDILGDFGDFSAQKNEPKTDLFGGMSSEESTSKPTSAFESLLQTPADNKSEPDLGFGGFSSEPKPKIDPMDMFGSPDKKEPDVKTNNDSLLADSGSDLGKLNTGFDFGESSKAAEPKPIEVLPQLTTEPEPVKQEEEQAVPLPVAPSIPSIPPAVTPSVQEPKTPTVSAPAVPAQPIQSPSKQTEEPKLMPITPPVQASAAKAPPPAAAAATTPAPPVPPSVSAPSQKTVTPPKSTAKAPPTPGDNGSIKTAAKPAKIADQLGLEFDDGGSTELVTFSEKPREYTEMVVNSLPARVFVAVMVIMDIILTIMDLAKAEKTGPDQAAFDWISFITGLIFVVDVAGRLYAYGFERYFSDPWEAADFGIVCVTFSVSVAMLALDADSKPNETNWLKVVTFLRVLRIFRLIRLISSGTGAARQQVGQNKRRYQKDGFDLDLTYITDQCIAMSFPSEGRTAMFRNPMTEVSRFMKTKHPGHYYVWNLCAERGYESHWFEQRCGRLLVDDHNVPKLKELVDWADKVKDYTAESKDNILVVHCKGGKGRTGTCIATWMLATDFLKTADLALRHFGERRTDDRKGKAFQGVETPSQSRYVNYYEKIKYNGWPVVRKIEIKAFTIQNISPIGRGNGSCIFFKIFNYGKQVFFGNVADLTGVTCAVDRQLDRATIHLKTPLVVKDDIKFMFYSSEKSVPRNYEDCGFYFWLHTGFFPASGNLTLGRHELDNPHKSKTWNTFTDGFSCTVHFSILS